MAHPPVAAALRAAGAHPGRLRRRAAPRLPGGRGVRSYRVGCGVESAAAARLALKPGVDFFEHQDRARRNTGKLIALFVLALVCLTALLYGIVLLLMTFTAPRDARGQLVDLPWGTAFLFTAIGVVVVVGGAALIKTAELRSGGGARVAESLGGRRVDPDTAEPLERRLLNVVEEMALASGAPVPPVYLMEREEGINAFAAGYTPETAVIGVTRGCVQQLTRAELQGVVAHEFSHILHGDMRLNVRLMGVVFGLVVIAVLGRSVLNMAWYMGMMGGGRRSGNDRDNGVPIQLAMMLVGVAVIVIGSLGVLFGRLIQAAASRQREYLADASAVQYTRNPDGIAGALARIGGLKVGAALRTPHAEESAHMFFGQALSSGISSMFATHPPLKDRISRIQQIPEAAIAEAPSAARPRAAVGSNAASGLVGAPGASAAVPEAGQGRAAPAADAGRGHAAPGADPPTRHVVDRVGHIPADTLRHTRGLIERIPADLRAALRHTGGAEAVVLCLLLSPDDAVRRSQRERIRGGAADGTAEAVDALADTVRTLDPQLRLPVLDLACGALSRLSAIGYERLRGLMTALIEADGREDAFEWTIRVLVERHLAERFGGETDRPTRHRSLDAVADELGTVMSILSWIGARDEAAAAAAFAEGIAALRRGGLSTSPRLVARDRLNLPALAGATEALGQLAPLRQRDVVRALSAVIGSDHSVTSAERELFRGVLAAMGVPLGPA